MKVPEYLTILRWVHAHRIQGYEVTMDALRTLDASEVLANEYAKNLLDAFAYDGDSTAEYFAKIINQWAEERAGALESLPIGLQIHSQDKPKPTVSAKPPTWTPLAKQFGRVIMGASVHWKRYMRASCEMAEGWMGEKATRVAVRALEFAARADGVQTPLIATRGALLSLLFDGSDVPEAVEEGE